jgi:dolichyl-phosphate beta-glucosyltransferase
VVVPAYNEEDRLSIMLAEAVAYLEKEYPVPKSTGKKNKPANGTAKSQNPESLTGYEIIIVSDGSTDATISTALKFARSSPSPSTIRVVSLAQNRGKGGAVIHGLRHVRGQYAIFADADGASRFSDLGALITACKKAESQDLTGHRRGVAVGSRAHLVGSEAVVKRSFLRNFLMHGFHLFLRILTPPKTARIRDTQCGFKLFSRSALPDIVPYMHSEGWIFDVEMLMLAESSGIPVAEVPIGWQEVKGSKLNVIKDSLGMAWGLAILRLAWGLGVYRRS